MLSSELQGLACGLRDGELLPGSASGLLLKIQEVNGAMKHKGSV